MSHHLPTDLTIEILACLPVKSLLRFTSVCQNWYSIIKNPSFIDTHRNRFGKRSSDQLLVKLHDSEGFFLFPVHEKNDNICNGLLGFPFHGLKQGSVCLGVVNSCNGLICLYDTDCLGHVDDIIIWNPWVRKSVSIPPPKILSSHPLAVGFGFDLVKTTFKVVMILDAKEEVGSEVNVYDQGGKEWRPIGLAPPHYSNIWFHRGSQYFVQGAVHWVVENEFTDVKSIVAFEIGDEVFKDIALPQRLPKACDLSISSFKDSLIAIGGWWEHDSLPKMTECHVWMMRDYGVFESWTNLYYIILPSKMNRPLGFRKNGEILFACTKNMLISLDPNTIITTNFSIMGLVASSAVLNFVESLVLLT